MLNRFLLLCVSFQAGDEGRKRGPPLLTALGRSLTAISLALTKSLGAAVMGGVVCVGLHYLVKVYIDIDNLLRCSHPQTKDTIRKPTRRIDQSMNESITQSFHKPH